jgi:hypothetical protein
MSDKQGLAESGPAANQARQGAASDRPRMEKEPIAALRDELLYALERTAQLEGRVRRLEEGFAAASPHDVATPPSPSEPEVAHVTVRPINSWRWDETAEQAYWLRRCKGFRVCDSSGVLGSVDSIRFGDDLDLPETLVVLASHRWRHRRFEVAVSEIADISSEREQITLAVPGRDWLLPAASRWSRLASPRSLGRITAKH